MQSPPPPSSPPPIERLAPRPPASSLFERRGPLVAVLLAVLIIGALLHPFPAKFVFRNGGDCVRYLTWSRVVAAKGLWAFPGLVEEYRSRWVGFPPPTRWGWLLAIAGVMRLWPGAATPYQR